MDFAKREVSSDPGLVEGSPEHRFGTLSENFLPPADKRFDASQYAFFGRDVTHEIEIGGLDEEDTEQLDDPDDEGEKSFGNGKGGSLGGQIGTNGSPTDLVEVAELAFSFVQLQGNTSSADRETAESLGYLEAGRKPICVEAPICFSQVFEPSPSNWLDHKQQETPVEQGVKNRWPKSEQKSTPGVDDINCLVPSSIQTQQHQWHGGSQQLPQNSPLLPPQVVLQYQFPHVPQVCSTPGSPYPQLRPQHLYHAAPLTPQMLPKMGESLGSVDFRDLFPLRGRPTLRHHHGVAEGISFRNTHSNGWQPLRSKYMTVEEIENIVRIQWAATHSSDPYVDDYYHQAMQAKLSRGSPHGRRHFAPSHLRDLPSHTRGAVEPHAYLQVDALGRVPFSSIRRPRPLLEVDSVLGSGELFRGQGEGLIDGVSQYRPLEQEPMLAARIAIEEGLCLLLDVDDIDRLLTSSVPPDGGAQLKRRRQHLVEGLAASLHLEDANGNDAGVCGINACFIGLAKDNLLFLRLVSLPKGQKFLMRYFQLLTPGSELVRIVALAVCRHLRFLFGGVQSDRSTLATTVGLANEVAVSVSTLDLSALSACLASVLLAPEQPPLRPMGSLAGDGATVVLRAVLERATSLLTDRNAAHPLQIRAVWQASFDAFFSLLAKYCTNKYDSIFHSLMMASASNLAAVNAAATVAMSKEMPVELLRASLPHTNDHQRNLLLEFTQRSISMGSLSLKSSTDDRVTTTAPER